MTYLKKITAVLLALVLCFSTLIVVFAEGEATETLPFEDSQFFETDGYKLHYRVWEAENEIGKVFMIHGFALSSYCWTELASRLVAQGYTCVLADLPDFGYSSRDTKDMQQKPREDLMHSLMLHLSSEPWYVAGHSMGGYITLALAEKYPEAVKNILLYGTSGNSGQPDSLKAMMRNDFFIAIMAPLMELMTRFDFLVRALLSMGLGDKEYAKNYDLSRITEPLRIKGTGAGALYSFSLLPTTNFEAVRSFSPVLYMNGSRDKVIADSAKDKLREYLPDGSIDIVIDGGAHMFIENYAEQCAQYTLDFLASNP